MSHTTYKEGSYNVLCDRCGRKFKSNELRKTWDGLMVCRYDFEVRHPQDFVRGAKDNFALPWGRPQPIDYDLDGNPVSPGVPTPG
jgi:hypothetical protein